MYCNLLHLDTTAGGGQDQPDQRVPWPPSHVSTTELGGIRHITLPTDENYSITNFHTSLQLTILFSITPPLQNIISI